MKLGAAWTSQGVTIHKIDTERPPPDQTGNFIVFNYYGFAVCKKVLFNNEIKDSSNFVGDRVPFEITHGDGSIDRFTVRINKWCKRCFKDGPINLEVA